MWVFVFVGLHCTYSIILDSLSHLRGSIPVEIFNYIDYMCTRDEVFTFSDPVLFPSVPVTYVITIEGSQRYDKLVRELRAYRPTRKVVIVHHKSFSDCARPHGVSTPSQDLWRNNLMIAKRDLNSPVMILEDDVHFLPTVHDYAEHIDQTIANDRCEIYTLGITPGMSFPSFNEDMTILLGGCAQAVLFSTRARQRLVREYGEDLSYKASLKFVHTLGLSWLHDNEIYYMFHTLAPKKPCAVQSHPLTENQKEWRNVFKDIVFDFSGARDDGTMLYEIHHALGCYFGGSIPFLVLIAFLILYSSRSSLI
jgi:hypothetical protein